MERILLFIKHNLTWLWNVIESLNGIIFSRMYFPRMNYILGDVLNEAKLSGFVFRKLIFSDLFSLNKMISNQNINDLKYFQPHDFDMPSLIKQYKNPAFLMLGTFDGERLVGYFFLRFFINKKCFVGRFIDKEYRGKGIGQTMNYIMYETAWRMGFRCLSTISKNNEMVMKAHAKNPYLMILKKLDNDYLLVEFVKND